ncbi:unnamed protein product [[Candida] boidinii]|nr:unnamed protein product [[Candida] boidinii]
MYSKLFAISRIYDDVLQSRLQRLSLSNDPNHYAQQPQQPQQQQIIQQAYQQYYQQPYVEHNNQRYGQAVNISTSTAATRPTSTAATRPTSINSLVILTSNLLTATNRSTIIPGSKFESANRIRSIFSIRHGL